MSVHRRNRGWQVKWRENGRQRSRMFDRKGDANAWDREVKRAKQLGPKLLRELTAPTTITLRQFVNTGWRAHAVNLDHATRQKYKWALTYHLQELLDVPLVEIDVPRIAEHQQYLRTHPRAVVAGEHRTVPAVRSVTTVRRAIEHLSGILTVAVEHGEIPANPARSMRKLQAERKRPVQPLAPADLEAVIAGFAGRDRIICVLLGHCGLRPIEARLVPWGELRDDTLTIRADLTKATAAYARTIIVPAETLRELRRWRLESGVPADDQPIIGSMAVQAFYDWGPRKLKPAVKATIGRTDKVTPYLLRHTHASLLHYCGYTVPSAAERMGHAATEHLATYAHVVKALEGRPQRFADLDELIAAARAGRASAPALEGASG